MQTIYEARRSKANRYRVRTVHDPSAALERLEKRLAAAESKRLAALHAVKVRAAVTANRAAAVARAEAARRKQLQSRLEQSLEAADVARAAHLADTAARAARTSNKAFASARVAKQREQTQAASRLTTLLHRMKRAETSREQVLVARKESAAAVAASSAVTIPTGLQQMQSGAARMSISPLNDASILLGDGSPDVYMATTDDNAPVHQQQHSRSVMGLNAGQWLRHQAAARRIQRNWRYFALKNGTTEVLVGKFAASKIPFSYKAQSITENAVGIEVEATAAAAAAPPSMVHQRHQQQRQQEDEGQQTNQDDFATLPGNNSPRSTLPPGRIVFTNTQHNNTTTTTYNNSHSGRRAPANTPADGLTPVDSSTPADTPRAGSPPIYGPPTPPMAVPISVSFDAIAAAEAGAEGNAVAAHAPRENLLTETSQAVSTTSFSALSPSPRRQPVARLVSSLADIAASTSLHEETPVPLPASFHESTLSFDEFAEAMSATETLKAAQAVLRRFEDMGKVKKSFARGDLCDGLLKRLFPRLPKGKKADRYPPRAFLSAYMIQSHPEVVLSQQGPRETALAEAAGNMLASFEALLSRFLKTTASSSSGPSFASLPSLLRQFDESWVAYLELFIAWKSHDAAGLESELIRAAVELETSRLLKVGSRAAAAAAAAATAAGFASISSTNINATAAMRAKAAKQDLEALEEGVDHDLKLISERVERLTGQQGAARLEAALAAARASAEQQQQLNSVNAVIEATTTGVIGPSPSNSPAKKVQRRQGQYANTSSTSPSPSSSVPSSPKQASPTEKEEEEDRGQGNQPQSQQQQPQSGSSGNLVLMWQLLYDSTFHLPTDEAESSWKDAVGETDPMLEPAPTPRDLENLLHQGGSRGSPNALAAVLHARVRRIAEKAFWDDLGERLSSGGSSSRSTDTGNGEETAAATAGQATNNSSNAAVSAAVAILAEAGAALRAVLPEESSAAADVTAQLGSAERLAELLTATPNIASSSSFSSLLPGINCDALFQMLEWCGELLRRLGAPAREAAAAAAQATIRKDLASETSPAAAGKIVARALRLIAVLLKLLRLDMANAHLGMLARQLGTTPERAALYARSKMQDFLGTPTPTMAASATTTAAEGGLNFSSKMDSSPSSSSSSPSSSSSSSSFSARDMALKLPHTRGWLALASGRLPHVETMLSEAANSSRVSVAAESGAAAGGGGGSISQELPRRLLTGRATKTGVNMNPSTATTSPTGLAGQLAVPISPKTWQGLVRCGLAQLVAGEGAVTHLALPETLTPDSGRLQGAQNEFQRLVVLTASLLALQHVSRLAGASAGAGAGAAACIDGVNTPAFVSTSTSNTITENAKRRLSAVLASPDVCLADVAAEIASLVQAQQQETSIHAVLRNMLGKSSPALRSITSALCNALTAHLVLGTSSPAAANASHAALTRSGAGALGAEVAILAGKLAEVAAVTEAVCGPWYEILSADLLITTGN